VSSSEHSQSPIPDLSEELDLLPTDLYDYTDNFNNDSFDTNDNAELGYDEEDYEDEDEEDQLKRIFEEFDPGSFLLLST
jgi:hypothetical protein